MNDKRIRPYRARKRFPVTALLLVLTFALGVAVGRLSTRSDFLAWTAAFRGTAEATEQPDEAETPERTDGAENNAPSETPQPEPEPQNEPQPQPQSEPEPPHEPDAADRLLAQMSLREKLCQMFVVSPTAVTGTSKVTAAGETTRKALERCPVGGFLYDRSNLVNRAQTQKMLANVQRYSRIPLLLACDEEGGRVNRLMGALGTTYIGPMLDYQDRGPETAHANAETIAGDMVSCGFNMDLAPVADVWSDPKNTVIGDRAYSTDFSLAAMLVPAAVEGFHAGGVACVLKHFPGHGNTSGDTHYGAVYVEKTLDELREAELLPFRAGIEAGADAVMVGHMTVSQVDDQPAPFSYRVVTELLRGELGFRGVVMTDGLQMKAMTQSYGSGEIAVRAVKAGVDVLLCPADLEEAIQALDDAVKNGEIPETRIDESVLRILRLKLARGILTE